MEKILVAVNSRQINTVTIDFACYLANLTKSKLTTLFLKDKPFELIPSRELKSSYNEAGQAAMSEHGAVDLDTDKEVRFFIDACKRRGVTAEILLRGKAYGNEGSPVDETVNESRFADLLIIDAETSFGNKTESLPGHFVQEVATRSECPVVIATTKFDGIEELIFCYDGGRSAVFAIKQFTYLFPQLSKKRIVILEVDRNENTIKQKEKISNWLQQHYVQIDFQELIGDAREEMLKYFLMKEKQFVIMGAYGRSHISNLFKRSSANLLMRVVDLPLFISHQ